MHRIQDQLNGKLVVSCQAAPGDPLEDVEVIRRIARTATGAGAAGLRINSAECVAAIRKDTDIPVIGIQKCYRNNELRITPDFASAESLAAAGASIIALDCTSRSWDFGEPWQQLIERIHRELKLPIMADVATLEEGRSAASAGADFVGTTLNGYTEDTRQYRTFNWQLLHEMVGQLHVPIIAEGHLSTPEEARRALAIGACCIVVGSAITRPGVLTARFVRSLPSAVSVSPAVGVDLGATSIKAGLVGSDGSLHYSTQVATDAKHGRDVISAHLASGIEQVMAYARESGFQPCGLGIASAGAIDARTGSVFAATDNLPGWAGFALRAYAEGRFHMPTYVLNDAHAAVLAELHFGIGRTLSDFIAITIGTGIGGGVVLNGQLVQGQYGFAGTIGHQTVRYDGPDCNCGRKGCLEAYVSTASLLQQYAKRCATPFAADMSDSQRARHISELALSGDPAATAAYAALAVPLAHGIANLFNLFDPQAIFISGGLVEGQTRFIENLQTEVEGLLHFGRKRMPRIQLASSGHYAGVQGAAAFVFSEHAKE